MVHCNAMLTPSEGAIMLVRGATAVRQVAGARAMNAAAPIQGEFTTPHWRIYYLRNISQNNKK